VASAREGKVKRENEGNFAHISFAFLFIQTALHELTARCQKSGG
jgi:hypothetical protein